MRGVSMANIGKLQEERVFFAPRANALDFT
jgi:hypothetical protein